MRQAVFFLIAVSATSVPAQAGIAIPTPEAGAGMAAMGLIALGYAVLRRRSQRD